MHSTLIYRDNHPLLAIPLPTYILLVHISCLHRGSSLKHWTGSAQYPSSFRSQAPLYISFSQPAKPQGDFYSAIYTAACQVLGCVGEFFNVKFNQ